jgi:hypothetical protein
VSRIRTLKPEWLDDEQLASCSDAARVLSVALVLLADDYGNGRASEMYLAGRVWMYGDAQESIQNSAGAMQELCRIKFCRTYEVNGQRYFHIANWSKHQRVQRPGKPRVPGPPAQFLQDAGKILPDAGSEQEPGGTDQRSTTPINDPDQRPPINDACDDASPDERLVLAAVKSHPSLATLAKLPLVRSWMCSAAGAGKTTADVIATVHYVGAPADAALADGLPKIHEDLRDDIARIAPKWRRDWGKGSARAPQGSDGSNVPAIIERAKRRKGADV